MAIRSHLRSRLYNLRVSVWKLYLISWLLRFEDAPIWGFISLWVVVLPPFQKPRNLSIWKGQLFNVVIAGKAHVFPCCVWFFCLRIHTCTWLSSFDHGSCHGHRQECKELSIATCWACDQCTSCECGVPDLEDCESYGWHIQLSAMVAFSISKHHRDHHQALLTHSYPWFTVGYPLAGRYWQTIYHS